MKKHLIFSVLMAFTFQATNANSGFVPPYVREAITDYKAKSPLSWHEARKAIVKKAEHVVKSYDNSLCVWTTRMFELILAKDFETESWEISQRIIEEVLPQLPVYKKFLENPYDEIYCQELVLQSSMIAGQIAGKIQNNFEFGAKVGAIIASYIDILKENLRKK